MTASSTPHIHPYYSSSRYEAVLKKAKVDLCHDNSIVWVERGDARVSIKGFLSDLDPVDGNGRSGVSVRGVRGLLQMSTTVEILVATPPPPPPLA